MPGVGALVFPRPTQILETLPQTTQRLYDLIVARSDEKGRAVLSLTELGRLMQIPAKTATAKARKLQSLGLIYVSFGRWQGWKSRTILRRYAHHSQDRRQRGGVPTNPQRAYLRASNQQPTTIRMGSPQAKLSGPSCARARRGHRGSKQRVFNVGSVPRAFDTMVLKTLRVSKPGSIMREMRVQAERNTQARRDHLDALVRTIGRFAFNDASLRQLVEPTVVNELRRRLTSPAPLGSFPATAPPRTVWARARLVVVSTIAKAELGIGGLVSGLLAQMTLQEPSQENSAGPPIRPKSQLLPRWTAALSEAKGPRPTSRRLTWAERGVVPSWGSS